MRGSTMPFTSLYKNKRAAQTASKMYLLVHPYHPLLLLSILILSDYGFSHRFSFQALLPPFPVSFFRLLSHDFVYICLFFSPTPSSLPVVSQSIWSLAPQVPPCLYPPDDRVIDTPGHPQKVPDQCHPQPTIQPHHHNNWHEKKIIDDNNHLQDLHHHLLVDLCRCREEAAEERSSRQPSTCPSQAAEALHHHQNCRGWLHETNLCFQEEIYHLLSWHCCCLRVPQLLFPPGFHAAESAGARLQAPASALHYRSLSGGFACGRLHP